MFREALRIRGVITRGSLSAVLILAAETALGQRVQFPSMVAPDPANSRPGFSSAAGPPATGPPSLAAPPPSAAPPAGAYGAPSAPPGAAPWDPYARASTPAPYSPYSPSPYATPAATPLYPDGFSSGTAAGFLGTVAQPLRFFQNVRGRYTWLAGEDGEDLDVNDIELSATAALPMFANHQPLLITPGFAFHFLDGPDTMPPAMADLPSRVYDAFLDLGWKPQITSWLSADLGVRLGVYSDFQAFTSRSFRVMGRGLGVVTLTPTVQVAAGVIYLDRHEVKLLPAGGIIWTPDDASRYEILFPNPKLARRWTTWGTTEIWYYLAGEFGGGAWTIERLDGANDAFDYNDLRVILGLETVAASGLRGVLEVGYVFEREILYRSDLPHKIEPGDTVMLRAGISY